VIRLQFGMKFMSNVATWQSGTGVSVVDYLCIRYLYEVLGY